MKSLEMINVSLSNIINTYSQDLFSVNLEQSKIQLMHLMKLDLKVLMLLLLREYFY